MADVMEGSQCMPTEADLQRACGTLYITHGLESSCGLLLFVFFSIVAVKLHCRSHLNSPALAFIRFLLHHSYNFIDEYITTLYTVGQMDEMNLEVRLRFCSNVDKMVNAASAALALLGITRWLSIGNVNGARYIGYAITCPMMQVELVALIAPFVPCYQLFALSSFALTFFTLTTGYAASLFDMPVYEGDALVFVKSWDLNDLRPTDKCKVVAVSFACIAYLWAFTLPTLVLIYTCHGSGGHKDLPPEYRLLVLIVWCTWLGFPIWWMFSWEGNGLITDTKFNEVGFTVLNMLAKGLFTVQGFRVGELAEKQLADMRSKNRGSSQDSVDSENAHVPPIISRASSRKLSRSQFVNILRKYDQDEYDSGEESGSDYGDSCKTGHTRGQGASQRQERRQDREFSPEVRHQRGSSDRREQRVQFHGRGDN